MDAGGGWRALLHPDERSRIVNKIMETLRRHLPVAVPEGLAELHKIAVRFEDKIYTAARNQSDYLRKISLKLLSMGSQANTQQNPGPAIKIHGGIMVPAGSSSKGKKQKKLRCNFCKKGGHFKKDCLKRKIWFKRKGIAYDPTHKRTKAHGNKNEASVDSTAQSDLPGIDDFQEELYQMIKSLKDQYFAELNDLYNRISIKIQHIDNHMPSEKPAEQYEKMKGFKVMLERTLHFLQVNKSSIQPAFREKIPVYQRNILNIISSLRRKPVQAPGQQTFQQAGGQAPSSNISQQHQTSQGLQQHDSHTNQMPQATLPSMSTGVQTSGALGIQHVPAPQANSQHPKFTKKEACASTCIAE